MNAELLKTVLLQIGAGAVAAEDVQSDDFDPEAIAAKIKEAQKKILAPEFKGRYYNEFVGKIAKQLKEAGVISDETTISELKELPAEEFAKFIDKTYKDKTNTEQTTAQKSVQEQLETLKTSLQSEHQKAMKDLQTQLKQYQAKEFEHQRLYAVKGNLPDGFNPSELQLKAMLNLLESEADIKFNNGKPELYHKGTDVAFGLQHEKKELLELKNVLTRYAKELGIWSEKPQPQKVDISKILNSKNGNAETGNGVEKLPAHLQKNAKLAELAKQAFEQAKD